MTPSELGTKEKAPFTADGGHGRRTDAVRATQGGDTEGRYAVALLTVREYVRDLGAGEYLPPYQALAKDLHLTAIDVKTALRTLEAEGAVAVTPRTGTLVLGPTEAHPHDLVLQWNVQDRITAGLYSPGCALPTGLLAHEHGLTSQEVTGALRQLVDQQLIRYDPAGDYGPGYYVTSSSMRPDDSSG
ncbi:GntR family transcriptional regulator [Streptomyces sp. NEAU-S7GS2]|uniref:GntR family transcriptional regulator n=1 Tax=Streptomyces sp. NEAU-S7GS2 TaxID=2202000 RepID=UPI000D6F6DB1|nr:GntR family transcriptional regulator [Streptomyces sp. NEAU-S7GS2]AWN24807.1 hypothetical protein DKG71_00205 [Streptomyces sp. NEAU-S7GS2]